MRSAPSPPWAADPPPGESQNVDNPPSISGIAVGFGALSTILAFVVVCLRIYARAFVVRGLKADDYLMIISLGFMIGFFVLCIRLTNFGVGHHMWDVLLVDYSPSILKLTFFVQIIGCLMISFNKLSVLALYLIITPNKKFQAAVFALMGIVTVFTVAFIRVLTLECHPIEAQWDLSLASHQCMSPSVSPLLVLSIFNITIDIAVVLLPIHVILPLQIPKKAKIQCLLLFAAGGGLVCVAAIGRTVTLKNFDGGPADIDFTWKLVPELLWAFVEIGVGIIAASIPPIKPLYKRLMTKTACGCRGSAHNHPGVKLQNISDRDRGQKAHQVYEQQASDRITSKYGSADEELGMVAKGGDGMSSTLEKPILNGSPSKDSHAQGGRTENMRQSDRRGEVIIADFAAAH